MSHTQLFVAAIVVAAAAGCGKNKSEPGGTDDKSGPAVAQEKSTIKKWTQFSAPSGSFKATYPWGDAVHWPFTGFDPPLPEGISSAMKYRSNLSVMEGKNYVITDYFNIIEARFDPKSSSTKRPDALNQLLQDTFKNNSAVLSDPKVVTWGGQPAKEFEGTEKSKSTDKQAHVVVRVLATEKYGYIGIIRNTTGNLTSVDEKTFFDSFTLAPQLPQKGKTGVEVKGPGMDEISKLLPGTWIVEQQVGKDGKTTLTTVYAMDGSFQR